MLAWMCLYYKTYSVDTDTIFYFTGNLTLLVALWTLSVMVWSLWSLQAQQELSPSPFLPSSQARQPFRGLNTTSLQNSSDDSLIVGRDGFGFVLFFLFFPFFLNNFSFDTVGGLTDGFFDNSWGLFDTVFFVLLADFFLSTFTAPVFNGLRGASFKQTLSNLFGFLVPLFLLHVLFTFSVLILCSTMFSLDQETFSRMKDTSLSESL